MNSPTKPMNVILFATLGAAVVLSDAEADERFWINPAGGSFSDGANWDDGLGPPPGLGDTAIFDLDADYTVTFFLDAFTDRAIVGRGTVEFLFPPGAFSEYRLLEPSVTAPGLVIGDTPSKAAQLTINGGDLEAVFAHIGDTPGSIGILNLLGDVEFTLDEELRIGVFGDATLSAGDSSTLACNAATLAVAAGSTAEVIVTGPDAQWDVTELLTVGRQGEAEMTFAGGADLNSGDGIIAQQIGSTGSLRMEGFGSNWFCAGSIDVGLFTNGSLTIAEGASLVCEDFLSLSTFVDGTEDESTLRVADEHALALIAGDLHVGLVGNARLDVSTGGRIIVDGDLVSSFGGTSRIILSLGDEDDYPQPAIFVGGSAGAFTVAVQLLGFAPEAGDHFEVIEALGGIEELSFELPPLTPPLAWLVQQEGSLYTLRVISQSVPGDVNGDGVVDFTDLLLVLSDWGPCAGCASDLDGDGIVGFTDLLMVLNGWTR